MRLWRSHRKGLGVSIVSDGLIVCVPNHRPEMIRWASIVDVETEFAGIENSPSVIIRIEGRSRPIRLGSEAGLFRSSGDIDECVTQITKRSAAAREQANVDSADSE